MEERYYFCSDDGLRLGHVRRNLAIASALADSDRDAAVRTTLLAWRPALETLLADGGLAALGLRDIRDDTATVIDEWSAHDPEVLRDEVVAALGSSAAAAALVR